MKVSNDGLDKWNSKAEQTDLKPQLFIFLHINKGNSPLRREKNGNQVNIKRWSINFIKQNSRRWREKLALVHEQWVASLPHSGQWNNFIDPNYQRQTLEIRWNNLHELSISFNSSRAHTLFNRSWNFFQNKSYLNYKSTKNKTKKTNEQTRSLIMNVSDLNGIKGRIDIKRNYKNHTNILVLNNTLLSTFSVDPCKNWQESIEKFLKPNWVLGSFTSTWCKLVSSERKEPQFFKKKKCLHKVRL